MPTGLAAHLVGLDVDRQHLALAGLNSGITQAAVRALCERLRNEQADQPMFDAATFLQVEDYVAAAKRDAEWSMPARLLLVARDMLRILEASDPADPGHLETVLAEARTVIGARLKL